MFIHRRVPKLFAGLVGGSIFTSIRGEYDFPMEEECR